MRKLIFSVLLLLAAIGTNAQDTSAYINHVWHHYASDTSRTYTQITYLCDSLFTQAGYGVHTDSVSDTVWHEGTPYWKYNHWKDYWSSRCDVATGKLHDFAADAYSQLTQQGRTTSSGGTDNCLSASDLQSSFSSLPLGWKFIGPQSISATNSHGNSISQNLGQIHTVIVNPANRNEIYIADPWGGLWKTINANLAPNNTWANLTGNLPHLTGIGVQNVYVDFSTTPHRIFCLLGLPPQPFMPNNNNFTFRAIGLYYSADDGVTFSPINLTSSLPDIANDPILCMKYWPGNSSSINKFLFIGTKFKVIRLKINTPTSPDLQTMVHVTNVTSLTDAESPQSRFRGFTDIAFSANDPSVMYVSNKSNNGQASLPNTSGLYRITNANTCTTCTITGLPLSSSEMLGSKGRFEISDFPYSGFFRTNEWQRNPSNQNVECSPHATLVKSLEMTVQGSYLHPVTYKIAFDLTLPPHSIVKVVLKDTKHDNKDISDWGTDTIPTPGPLGNTYYVGDGYVPGTTAYSLTPGYYVNDGNSPHTVTITTVSPISVTASGYVNRLEFAAYPIQPDFTIGDKIILDNVSVVQEYEDEISNLATTNLSTTDFLYCVMLKGNLRKLYRIEDNATTYPRTAYSYFGTYHFPDKFILSSINQNIIYQYRTQSTDPARIRKIDLSTTPPIYTEDVSTQTYLHPDARGLCAFDNGDGTEDLYIGTDGGIARGKFGGPWYNLNGFGLNNSWIFDLGTNIYTGEVGTGNPDNGHMWSNGADYSSWKALVSADGAQLKYGKRYITRDVRFEGYSGSGDFTKLNVKHQGRAPYVADLSGIDVVRTSGIFKAPLHKLVTTYNGEYFGASTDQLNIENHIYSFRLSAIYPGSGSLIYPYVIETYPITNHPSFSKVPVVGTANPRRESIQSVAPDMYDADYMAAYMKHANYDPGYFAYSTNITASTPTWSVYQNNDMVPNGTNWQSLLCMTVDPRSPRTNKRIWVGAGGYYPFSDTSRVFENNCGGGACWKDISIGLPKGPVTALAYDDQSHYLFAGTDQGVYAFNVDNGPNSATNKWECYSLHLPNSMITALDINRCTGKIYAATLGRGAYAADLPPVPNNTGTSTAGPTDNIDINYVTSDATWTGEKWENRTVYVKTGVTLTLSGATLYMGKDKYIVVEPGAKLIVNNSRLTTSCGCTWGGIQAWGNNTQEQLPAYQATVNINNNSTIEHALVGVCNYNPSVPNTEGGIVQVQKSTFLNNLKAAHFRPYANRLPSGAHIIRPDLSSFIRTTFYINNEDKVSTSRTNNSSQVHLEGVHGVRFLGCDFNNHHSTFKGHGRGIYAVDAGFSVISFCPSTSFAGCLTAPIPSTFRGLSEAIHVSGNAIPHPHPAVSIDQALFDSVSIGVRISIHRTVSVTRCQFNIGRGLSYPFVEGLSTLGVPGSCGRNIGILTQNAYMFKIEQNTFTGQTSSYTISPWYNVGVLAANAGQATNRIYRNNFSGLTYGVLGVGKHTATDSWFYGAGLQVSCNSFSGNVNDIYSGGSALNEGIGLSQMGPLGGAASNTFSSSTRNVVNPNLTRPLHYFITSGTSVSTSGNVSLHTTSASACTSTLTDGSTSSLIRSYPIALSNGDLAAQKTAFFTTRARRDSISGVLSSTIDLGNTNALRYFIDTCANADTLFGKLTDVSPFLSRSVMDRIITKTIQVGSAYYQPLIDVMALNPEVISDYTYLKKAEQDLSMSSNDFDMLWDIASTTVSARGEVELAKGAEHAAMETAISDVILALKSPIDTNISQSDTTFEGICLDTASIYYLSDTNSRYIHLDSLDTWLALMGSNEATHERIGLRLSAGSYQQAAGMFNSLGYAAYNGDTTPTEQQEYSMLWDVLLDAATDGRSVFYLSDSDRARLVAPLGIALTDNPARTTAAVLLHANPVSMFPCASAPPVAKTGNNEYIKYPGINNTTTNKKDKLKAYPNPSDGMVTFQYQPSGMGSDEITVTVLNVLGEKVLQQNIESTTARLQWNAAKLPSGIYLYTGTNSKGTIIGKGKIVLNR